MRVLITGGAGFIGSHLADRLLARGDEVLVDRQLRDRPPRQPGASTSGSRSSRARSPTRRSSNEAFARLRARGRRRTRPPRTRTRTTGPRTSATNAVGTANVVKACRGSGRRAARLLPDRALLRHPAARAADHARPSAPPGDSSYAISKTAGEHYVQLSRPRLGLAPARERLRAAQRQRPAADVLPAAHGRTSPCFVMDTRRDFIYVEDLIDLVLQAVDGQGSGGAYHASSGSDYSIKELFDATVAALDLDPAPDVEVRERNPDDAFTILLDPSRTATTSAGSRDAARGGRRGGDRVLPRRTGSRRRSRT